jgi:hypothetical protein
VRTSIFILFSGIMATDLSLLSATTDLQPHLYSARDGKKPYVGMESSFPPWLPARPRPEPPDQRHMAVLDG